MASKTGLIWKSSFFVEGHKHPLTGNRAVIDFLRIRSDPMKKAMPTSIRRSTGFYYFSYYFRR